MTITINPKVEARLLERAEAMGLSVTAYVESLVNRTDPRRRNSNGSPLKV